MMHVPFLKQVVAMTKGIGNTFCKPDAKVNTLASKGKSRIMLHTHLLTDTTKCCCELMTCC